VRAGISDDAKPLVAAAGDCDTALSALQAASLDVDALRLVAFALPPREGVWWALTAVTHVSRMPMAKPFTPPMLSALAATEQWIANPDDAHRRAAWQAAQDAGLETAAGSAAGAAYFTGGSVAPQEITPIPPPPGIHAALTFVAVVAAAGADPEQFAPLTRAFVTQGVQLVQQLGGWDTSVAHARTHHDAMLEQHRAVTPSAQPVAGQ
jgi:hypothetical protein